MRTMPFRPAPALLVLASALVVTLGGCDVGGGDGRASPTIDVERRAAVNATTAPLLPTDVFALPEFTVERYQMLLGQLRGTPVVVNMWGSWCPPCRDEAPMLADAHREFGDRIQFLGIDIEDDRAGAIAFIREFDWRFPSIVDPGSSSRFRAELGFLGQPNTLFYDASGTLVRTWQGPLTAEALQNGIRRILPEG
jgi:cytochrome c biogenesis protein CcmG, thiol:disulfide interchange protein DsbE